MYLSNYLPEYLLSYILDNANGTGGNNNDNHYYVYDENENLVKVNIDMIRIADDGRKTKSGIEFRTSETFTEKKPCSCMGNKKTG